MTIMRVLQKRRKNPMCVLNPHVGIAIKEEKSSVGFETPCMYYKKGKKSNMCFEARFRYSN
jgi:hypothetical protein